MNKPNYYLIYYIAEKIGWIDFDLGIGWLDDDMLGELMGDEYSRNQSAEAFQPAQIEDPLDFPDTEVDPDDYRIEW